MNATLTGHVDANARITPNAEAAVFPTARVTYAQLAVDARRSAAALDIAGVRPGDRVGLLAGEGVGGFITAVLGTWRLGTIAVPLNARFEAHELEYAMRHAGLRVLSTSDDLAPLVREGQGAASWACATFRTPLQTTRPTGAVPEGDAMILYTSGTTADPKGCVYTHAGMVAQGRAFARRCEVSEVDRLSAAVAARRPFGLSVHPHMKTRTGTRSHRLRPGAGAHLGELLGERSPDNRATYPLIGTHFALLDT